MRWLMHSTLNSGRRKGQPRRRVKPLWRQRSLMSSLILLGVAVSGGASWWLWQTGWTQNFALKIKADLMTSSVKSGFAISEVFVEGRVETGKEELLRSLQLSRKTPILSLDLERALERVVALPWVRTAIIERQLPDVIHLRLEERRPLALWQNQGKFSLIDSLGEPIPLSDIGRFNNLVVVVGWDASINAAELLDTLAVAPEIARKVKAAVRVGGRRWDIQLKNRIEIKLPEEGAVAAWVQLAEMQNRHQLLDKDITIIDLRLPDRIFVRPHPGSKNVIVPGIHSGPKTNHISVDRNT